MLSSLKYALTAFLLITLAKTLQIVTSGDTSHHARKKESKEYHDNKKNHLKNNEHKNKTSSAHLSDIPSEKINSSDTLSSINNDSSYQKHKTEKKPTDKIATEKSTNQSVKNQSLKSLIKTYLNDKIANLPEGRFREDIVVRYYKNQKDEGKISALRNLKYYIHEKSETAISNTGSNVIYYGKNVATEDIQIIAYTLLEKGFSIKAMQPSRYSWKENAVEVGTDADILSKPSLTQGEIGAFHK